MGHNTAGAGSPIHFICSCGHTGWSNHIDLERY